MAPQATLVTRLKVQLKLAIARLRMVQQRDEQLGKTHRRAMAQLLEAGKVDSATIRVENIIRADITTELHEMLELYCELLLARAGLLEGAGCDPGLEEAVKSIMYAAPKTEIKELGTVRLLLAEKYGKEFAMQAMDNADGKVNHKVVRKLSVEPPRLELVQGYLEEISKAYGVDWPKRSVKSTPPPPDLLDDGGDDDDDDDDDNNPSGAQAQKALQEPMAVAAATRKLSSRGDEEQELGRATPPKGLGGPASPLTVTPPRMTTDNVHPRVTLGSMELKPNAKTEAAPTPKARGPEGTVPDINDLERRFAALKKR
ncbi:hypothetical protein CDD83_3563 [Cordyceps sp. RAO-2017]|nr:hypothetical protein CDD83_3563 [Cordyceps sp. RAO-2017]